MHVWIELPTITGWLLGVFDGHGGAATAERASQTVSAAFESSGLASPGSIPVVLRETVSKLVQAARQDLCGSTASLVFIPEDAQDIYWAVLGDSPLAAMDAADHLHFGPDHNVRSNLKERAAAESRGGIYRGGYLEDPELPGVGLQMTRSLGDAKLARVLWREPDIEKVPLGGRGTVLVGSDGLLSPGESSLSNQLSRILNLTREGAGAQAVVLDALHRKTGDNVTAMVWQKP